MKFNQNALCMGIKESKGEYEGRPFSSTTFHLSVDIADSSSGRSIGQVTRPFKFGDASEFEKWAKLSASWPAGGLPVVCSFELVAAADNGSKLVLLGIQPANSRAAA